MDTELEGWDNGKIPDGYSDLCFWPFIFYREKKISFQPELQFCHFVLACNLIFKLRDDRSSKLNTSGNFLFHYLVSGFRFSTAEWVWFVVIIDWFFPVGAPFSVDTTSYSEKHNRNLHLITTCKSPIHCSDLSLLIQFPSFCLFSLVTVLYIISAVHHEFPCLYLKLTKASVPNIQFYEVLNASSDLLPHFSERNYRFLEHYRGFSWIRGKSRRTWQCGCIPFQLRGTSMVCQQSSCWHFWVHWWLAQALARAPHFFLFFLHSSKAQQLSIATTHCLSSLVAEFRCGRRREGKQQQCSSPALQSYVTVRALVRTCANRLVNSEPSQYVSPA